MLIITRQAGQSFTLKTSDGEITVKVDEVANTYEGHYIVPRVKLAISAPANVSIERDDMVKHLTGNPAQPASQQERSPPASSAAGRGRS